LLNPAEVLAYVRTTREVRHGWQAKFLRMV
jgi:hypothetical protein